MLTFLRVLPTHLLNLLNGFNSLRNNTPFRTCLRVRDRKSSRLNPSHANISYAVFCLRLRPPRSTPFPYTTLFRCVLPTHLLTFLNGFNSLRNNTPFRTCLRVRDRKSRRLNSSHANISYAVFCL